MGLFGAGGSGFPYETALEDMTPVLGPPDQTYEHPAVECRNYAGTVNVNQYRTLTARWGDLFVAFTTDGDRHPMQAYVYGPPRAGYPTAYYGQVTLGTPLADLLSRPDAYLDGSVTPNGALWRVRSQAPGIAGMASGSGPDEVVTHIFIGTTFPCFGLPVDD